MAGKLILCIVAALGVAVTHAEEAISVAVVDLTKVFSEHPTTKSATAELTRSREISRDDFKQKSNDLKSILQKHQELIRAGKKDEATEELIKANEAEKAIATLRTTKLRDLEEEFRRTKLQIMKDIRETIAKFNAEGTYALVFDSSAASSNGLPQVVHAPGATDITAEVIAFMKKAETAP